MTKRFKLLAVLLTVFAMTAAACGSDTAETADETTTTAAPTTTEAAAEEEPEEEAPAEEPAEEEEPPIVRADADLVIWADDTRTPVILPLAEAFGAENGITVAVQEVNFGDIRDRLQTAGPAGEGPDVIIGAHDWLGQLVTS